MSGAGDAQAAFPGQNGRIAFYDSDGAANSGVFVIGSDGSNPSRIVAGQFGRPKGSPAGKGFAVSRASGGNTDVWTFNADGTGALRVTTESAADIDPAWSPDGSRLVFASN